MRSNIFQTKSACYPRPTLALPPHDKLDEKKKELQARIQLNSQWIAGFDTDLGPFEQLYKQKTQEIASIYDNAKVRHKKGIEVLQQEFSYHPEYFRPQDTFRGTPFVPK